MWPRWVTLVVAALALVAGCTVSSPPRPTPTPSVSATAPADTNPQPRSRVTEGGMVRVPLTVLPTAWNPWHPNGGTPEATAVRAPLSAGAFLFDPAGRPTPNPDYLANAAVTHEGHTRVVLSLNPKAVWSDGAPITASDWVATWQALRGADPAFQVVDDRGWRGVGDVRQGASDHEVVVEFSGVQPDWSRPLAAGPARAESVRDAATFNAGWPEYRSGWFTGPFVVGHIDRTQGVITLDANPLWWGERPKLEHVVYRRVQPEALAAAFQHNEFDLLEVTSASRLAQVRAAADATVRSAPGRAGRVLQLDTAGVLADAALRTALLRAIDRTALALADAGGLTPAPLVWANPLLLTNQPGYVDQAVATGLDHDRAAAAEEFTKAGWPLSGGRRERAGQPLTLTMAVPPGDARARAEFGALSVALADLGVGLTEVTGAADITPATVTFDRYPLAGISQLDSNGLADLTGRVATEVDPVRRADQAAQLSRRLWERATVVPLHQPPRVVAVRNGLANYGADGFASTRWEDVGWAR